MRRLKEFWIPNDEESLSGFAIKPHKDFIDDFLNVVDAKLLEASQAREKILLDALEHYEDIPIWKVAGVDTSTQDLEEIENEEYIAAEALEKYNQAKAGSEG